MVISLLHLIVAWLNIFLYAQICRSCAVKYAMYLSFMRSQLCNVFVIHAQPIM